MSSFPSKTHGNEYNTSAVPAFTRPHFLAPYLNDKQIQFKDKVKARIITLLVLGSLSSPAPVPKNAVIVRT